MKKRSSSSAAPSSKFVALLAIIVVGGLGSLLVTASLAATNHQPSGKFSPLTCTWDTTKNDYKYTIPASWSDPDASKTDPANAYLGNSSSKANNPKSPDALDGTGHNGPSYTWNFYRSTLTDTAWPVQLFVHDAGNATAGIWTAEASVAKPTCPAPPNSGGDGSTGGSGSTNSGGGGSGGGSTKTTTKTGTGVSIPSVSPPADTTDATVTAGTTNASLQVPADNATSLHLAYGTDGQTNNSTADQTLNSNTATIELDSLTAKTNYTYQIVRTNAGGTTTSANGSFTTKGYTISVKFTDAHGNAVSGLSGSLNDSRNSTTKSDKSGTMTFSDLDGGNYTLTVSYRGHQHTLDYDTTSIDNSANAAGTPAVLSDIIDVSQFTSVAVNSGSGGHGVVKVILIVLLVGVVGTGVFLFIRRRKARATYQRLLGNSPADAIDRHTAHHFETNPPPPVVVADTTAHTNESLRDMVVKSMHEQALKKQQQPPTQPPVPPQP